MSSEDPTRRAVERMRERLAAGQPVPNRPRERQRIPGRAFPLIRLPRIHIQWSYLYCRRCWQSQSGWGPVCRHLR